MEYIIRKIETTEYCLLSDFLYHAIYLPEGVEPLHKSIIEDPKLQLYIYDFGKSKHDEAIVAEVKGSIVGIVWVRIMNDYGNIDNETPSLAMSIFKEYRSVGIGTNLLRELLSLLKSKGYPKVSLSVQKDNYAVKLYQKVGFNIYDENDEEYIMVCYL